VECSIVLVLRYIIKLGINALLFYYFKNKSEIFFINRLSADAHKNAIYFLNMAVV